MILGGLRDLLRQQMLATSDKVVRAAYGRMVLSSGQKWMSQTAEEVEFIVIRKHRLTAQAQEFFYFLPYKLIFRA